MLQVYDRVLGSRSEPTLVALSALVAFLFLMMGVLDHARSRLMARIGARFQEKLDRRVFAASVRRLTMMPNDPAALAAQRDLEAMQRLWSSPVLLALFDIPWTPFFAAAIFIFNPLLGWLAVGGGLVLLLGAVPLLLLAWPGLADYRLAGLPLTWWVIGASLYPALTTAAWWLERAATRAERDFVEIVDGAHGERR